jgi:hypothetical protein
VRIRVNQTTVIRMPIAFLCRTVSVVSVSQDSRELDNSVEMSMNVVRIRTIVMTTQIASTQRDLISVVADRDTPAMDAIADRTLLRRSLVVF